MPTERRCRRLVPCRPPLMGEAIGRCLACGRHRLLIGIDSRPHPGQARRAVDRVPIPGDERHCRRVAAFGAGYFGLGAIRQAEFRLPGGTTRGAAGRDVDELFLPEEMLFTGRPCEWFPTLPACKGFVLKVHLAPFPRPVTYQSAGVPDRSQVRWQRQRHGSRPSDDSSLAAAYRFQSVLPRIQMMTRALGLVCGAGPNQHVARYRHLPCRHSSIASPNLQSVGVVFRRHI